jgi:hypothetical protein
MQHCVTFPCQNTMKKILLLTLTVFVFAFSKGQSKNSIELNIFSRFDNHADYTTRFLSRASTNRTQLTGMSHGLNINYSKHLLNKMKLTFGLGYYQLRIDEIRQATNFGNYADSRVIDYHHPSGIKPVFYTDHYHYNNLTLSAGLGYEKPLCKNTDISISGEINYLYNYSQYYHVTWGDGIDYRENNKRVLGFNANLGIGVIEKLNSRYYISPKLLIGIYQKLNSDPVFGEDPNLKMVKWVSGAGISFSVGKYF